MIIKGCLMTAFFWGAEARTPPGLQTLQIRVRPNKIPKRRSAGLNATVFKTSAGAASYVPVARVSNLAAAIDKLKENGVWIYGTDMSGNDYCDTDFSGGCAIVIGSEGFGISRLIKEKCDFMIKLPMLGKINSLNASVAAGIFMYEVVRQRSAK